MIHHKGLCFNVFVAAVVLQWEMNSHRHSKLEQIAHEKRQLAIRVRGLVDRLQQVEDVRVCVPVAFFLLPPFFMLASHASVATAFFNVVVQFVPASAAHAAVL